MDRFVCASVVVATFFIATGSISGNIQQSTEQHVDMTNVVLIGATGDLAKKYLWNGLFNLYRRHSGSSNQFTFIGAARLPRDSGSKQMQDILEVAVKCNEQDVDCQFAKKEFIRLCTYTQLKTELDYQKLGESFEKTTQGNTIEKNRIFYLSVPPFAYGEIAHRINTYCRPKGPGSLRVVFEKPFGSDLKSATELAKDLAKYLKEEEMYRIDHYLGKAGVAQILKFRLENKHLYEHLLNKDHVTKVELVLKERDDCKGRTGFYDKYGVIRDVIQNHITELLALVAMELPSCSKNVTDIHSKKIRILSEIIPPSARSAVIGQYKDYRKHHVEENIGKQGEGRESSTPTFAAVIAFINNRRWQGVPFIVTSGKKLDERTAYVRVLFKSNIFHINAATSNKCGIRQLIFDIQGGRIDRPAVLVSHGLPEPSLSNYWFKVNEIPVDMFGCQGDSFKAYSPEINNDAYSTLINGVFSGKKDLFIGTDDLIASWKVWTPLLDSLKSVKPRLYDADTSVLDFITVDGELKFIQTDEEVLGTCDAEDKNCELSSRIEDYYRLPLFRGNRLFTGPETDVVYKLRVHILEHASAAIAARGVFHLALSGGSTPLKLFRQLSIYLPDFLLRHTHIWMVDERCVPITDEMSNFYHLYNTLLHFGKIPFFNIHPMMTSLGNGLCNPVDNGAGHYEAELRRVLGNNQLDYVVLGVGSDGHTASLFPGHFTVNESQQWVILSSCTENCPVKQRMTMTLALLNKAKTISILVLGEKKQDIVKKLCSREHNTVLPVTKVKPVGGELLWCVDDLALGNISSCDGSWQE